MKKTELEENVLKGTIRIELEKVANPIVNQILKILEKPHLKFSTLFIDATNEKNTAGIVIHNNELISIFLYHEKEQIFLKVRFVKDLFPEVTALLIKELANIVKIENIFIFGSFYISLDGEVYLDDEAGQKMMEDMYNSVSGSEKLLTSKSNKKTYLC